MKQSYLNNLNATIFSGESKSRNNILKLYKYYIRAGGHVSDFFDNRYGKGAVLAVDQKKPLRLSGRLNALSVNKLVNRIIGYKAVCQTTEQVTFKYGTYFVFIHNKKAGELQIYNTEAIAPVILKWEHDSSKNHAEILASWSNVTRTRRNGTVEPGIDFPMFLVPREG